jgi:putative RecB family exonuclease
MMPASGLPLIEAPPTATVLTVSVAAAPLAEVLSPSQCKTFLQCPARWYFRYVEGLPDVATGNLALGRAVHAAVGMYFRGKRDGLAPALIDVVEVYDQAIAMELEQAELRDDENVEELQETGRRCLTAYLEAAAAVEPKLIEEQVSGEIAGIPVRGILDLMDVEGTVSDLKTASRKPAAITTDYRLQLTMYALVTPGASGRCRVDTVTKQKTPQVVPQSFVLGASERRYAETLLPILQDAMREGRYWPQRDHHLCSRKYCPYWRTCEREFGGTVDN